MSELSAKDQYVLIVADIAMAAAIETHNAGYVFPADGADYVPGSLRQRWLASTGDSMLRKQVTSMASAAAASLQQRTGEQLADAADKYGVPLTPDTAQRIAEYFEARRNAVLSYNR